MLEYLISALFGFTIIVQLLFWCGIFSKLLFPKKRISSKPPLAVSVLISAKNEAKNIGSCLQAIIKEQDPITEIIVIDDFSTDQTESEIKRCQLKDSRIVYTRPPSDMPGKKQAITDGILKAQSSVILLTDGDCIPASPLWATLMISKLKNPISIVLGYSPTKFSGGLLNLWTRFETWITGVQYLSFALSGLPYMGVGRNLMYTKEVFIDNKGFESHQRLISGDDDLFVNAVANKTNTAVCLHPGAFVYTASAKSWQEYFSQKKRHFSVSMKYKLKHKILLSFFSLSQILFYALFIVLVWLSKTGLIFILLSILIVKWFLAYFIMKQMKESMIWAFPFLDLALSFYYLIMAPYLFLRLKSW